MYTGFAASESVKLSPEASDIVKSGAAGPSGEPPVESPGAEVDPEGGVEVDEPGATWGDGDEHAAATSARTAKTRRIRFMGVTLPPDCD